MSGFPSLRSLFVSLLFFSSTISSLAISGTGLSYANGVLENQYFTMETGNNWNGIDPVLTDTDILTSASFIHDDFTGSMTVIPLYDTYMSDIMYLDYMLENAESIAEVAGTVVAKEYFLTNQGHQAFAIHYETNLLGNTLSFYSFGIDGTTTGYQGTPGNWLYFPILISNSTLSFQQALDIAKTVEFTEGSPAPAKSMTEFNGLSPGGSSPIAYTPPSGTGLSYANGVLQNQYFTMETGNNWNGIDPVLTEQIYLPLEFHS